MVSALPVARHTERLGEIVAFYRDGLGLEEVGGFRDHDGYDDVFLGVPGTCAHLGFTAGGAARQGQPTPSNTVQAVASSREYGAHRAAPTCAEDQEFGLLLLDDSLEHVGRLAEFGVARDIRCVAAAGDVAQQILRVVENLTLECVVVERHAVHHGRCDRRGMN